MSTAPVTFINVFEVDVTRRAALVDLLDDALEQVIRHRPGFVAARLLVETSGPRVLNEVTWESGDAIVATQDDPAVADLARRAAALAVAAPGAFTVHARYEA